MKARAIVLFLGAICLSGCVLSPAQLGTLEGNGAFAEGAYQTAISRYLVALQEPHTDPYALEYNLGNVYHSLGEVDAAFRQWEEALKTDNSELIALIEFNRGLARYEQGDYRGAAASFRRVLQIRPADVDAKINLELTYLKSAPVAPRAIRLTAGATTAADQAEAQRLIEYVKRKEGNQWRRPKDDVAPSLGDDR